jgi:hypothetical protein
MAIAVRTGAKFTDGLKDSNEGRRKMLLRSVLKAIGCNMLRLRNRSISVSDTTRESILMKFHLKLE